MRMSPRGRQRLTDREGKRLTAYQDSKGIWTIGVGHAATSGRVPIPKAGMTITAEQCDAILTADLAERYEPLLNVALKVPVADHEFDALLSITFNVESFTKSTAIRLLNAGDRAGCAAHILDWNKPPEIIGRRHTEQSQFLTPYAGAAPKPVAVPRPQDAAPPVVPVPAQPGWLGALVSALAAIFKKG